MANDLLWGKHIHFPLLPLTSTHRHTEKNTSKWSKMTFWRAKNSRFKTVFSIWAYFPVPALVWTVSIKEAYRVHDSKHDCQLRDSLIPKLMPINNLWIELSLSPTWKIHRSGNPEQLHQSVWGVGAFSEQPLEFTDNFRCRLNRRCFWAMRNFLAYKCYKLLSSIAASVLRFAKGSYFSMVEQSNVVKPSLKTASSYRRYCVETDFVSWHPYAL